MHINDLKTGLNKLSMFSEDTPEPGFYWIKDKENITDPYIRVALETAAEFDVDAVYFRLFENRPPIPQIYLYDHTNKPLNEQDIAEKHRRIWSSCQVPLFFVFTKTDVKIFNSFKQPDVVDGELRYTEYRTIELIPLISDIDLRIKEKQKKLVEHFSAKNFDNGSFWEIENYKPDFVVIRNTCETLIRHLKETRKKVIDKKILSKSVANKLLVLSIFIKYLEERVDKDRRSVFPQAGQERRSIENDITIAYSKSFFDKYSEGSVQFIDVLKNNGKIAKLFKDLSIHFNGEIFQLETEEENEINNSDLKEFAEFLEAKTETSGQISIFRLYSFGDLPIELISNIYEALIVEEKKNQEGVVYTPPFLVNFLLDEAMPLTENKTDFKILDPACGSGIFLVQAYKRLIYRWRSNNGWERPTLFNLKDLLSKNIFGIDVNSEAIRVTAFSLTLALCDELSPLEIWNDLKFDNLREKNLIKGDFFKQVKYKRFLIDFDLIIGNPPFNIRSTEDFQINLSKWQEDKGFPIPDKNPALAFFGEAIELCKPHGQLCLILPSGAFLYNLGAFNFRKFFIEKYNLQYIIDFTHLSRFLFGTGKGDHPVIAVYIKKEPPTEHNILHITVRRTKPVKEKIWFELDKYDFHQVPRKIGLSAEKVDKLIWKSNFLGGGRIHFLIDKICSFNNTLGKFIQTKKISGWIIHEGYKIGNSKRNINNYKKETEELDFLKEQEKSNLFLEEKQRLEYLEKKYSQAPFLIGKDTLDSIGLTFNGINFDHVRPLKDIKYFYRDWIKYPKIFNSPHILIREVISNKGLMIDFCDKYLSFPSQIIGIHCPVEQRDELYSVFLNLKKNSLFYAFSLAALSGRGIITKSTSVLKDDIDNLPFPENEIKVELSEFEQILIDDTLNIFLPYRRQYAIETEAEKDVTLNPKYLEEFALIYLKILNSVYENYKPGNWLATENHIIFPFYWGDKSKIITDATDLEKHLNQLLQFKQPQANLRFIRVMTIYDENVIYLIKPKQYRYWLRSIAIRDADETFADLVKQEYNL